MLTAIIIISLISLLVATEAEPGDIAMEPTHDDPLRPEQGSKTAGNSDKTERIAA